MTCTRIRDRLRGGETTKTFAIVSRFPFFGRFAGHEPVNLPPREIRTARTRQIRFRLPSDGCRGDELPLPETKFLPLPISLRQPLLRPLHPLDVIHITFFFFSTLPIVSFISSSEYELLFFFFVFLYS